LLALGFVIVQGTLPFQLVAPIFWTQENAGDDVQVLLVGLMATIRGVAMVVFGIYGGSLADRFNRRTVLLYAQTGGFVVAAATVVVVMVGDGGPVAMTLLFALVFCSSALWAVDVPTRQAMVPDIVGIDSASRGLALATSGAWMLAPVTVLSVGFLIDRIGFSGAFGLVAVLQAAALLTLLPMRYRPTVQRDTKPARRRTALRDLREGIAYTWSQPALRWVVGLSALMTGIAMPAISGLGPTWVTTVVGASFTEFGFIAAFWGLGGLVAALLLTRFASPARSGAIVAIGAAFFATGFMVFGSGQTPLFAIVGNVAVGSGLVATQIAGVGLIAQIAPNEMRGRVTSLLLVDRALAQFLALPAAAIGQLVGLTVLFPILGVLCLSVVAFLLLTQRRFWLNRGTAENAAR